MLHLAAARPPLERPLAMRLETLLPLVAAVVVVAPVLALAEADRW